MRIASGGRESKKRLSNAVGKALRPLNSMLP
jgi:hypothetical protein